MIVGKAIYEGVLLKCNFARFFLNRFTEKATGSSRNQVDDLRLLDPDLYNNLMKLKYYEGNAEDLCLTFIIEEDFLGAKVVIPLEPNGDQKPVTK